MDMPMFTLVVLLVLVATVTLERIRIEWQDRLQDIAAKVLHSIFYGTIGFAVFVIAIHFHSVFFPTEVTYGSSVQQQSQPSSEGCTSNVYSPGK